MGDAPNKEEVIDTDMVNELVIEPAMRNVSLQIKQKESQSCRIHMYCLPSYVTSYIFECCFTSCLCDYLYTN